MERLTTTATAQTRKRMPGHIWHRPTTVVVTPAYRARGEGAVDERSTGSTAHSIAAAAGPPAPPTTRSCRSPRASRTAVRKSALHAPAGHAKVRLALCRVCQGSSVDAFSRTAIKSRTSASGRSTDGNGTGRPTRRSSNSTVLHSIRVGTSPCTPAISQYRSRRVRKGVRRTSASALSPKQLPPVAAAARPPSPSGTRTPRG